MTVRRQSRGKTPRKPETSPRGARRRRGRRRTRSNDARRRRRGACAAGASFARRRRGRGHRTCRRRRDGGNAAPRAALAPPIQDPGSHQAPPGSARAGRQGRARQQGRGSDDLSVARRPLFRPDAQHRARRRHFAQDHQYARPQPPEIDRPGSRSARRHGRHPAHRRRLAHEGGGEARFRISAADVGDRPRTDAFFERADPRLRGRLADQARHPRPLQQGRGGGDRRRRGGLSAKPRNSCAC